MRELNSFETEVVSGSGETAMNVGLSVVCVAGVLSLPFIYHYLSKLMTSALDDYDSQKYRKQEPAPKEVPGFVDFSTVSRRKT